MDLYGTLDPYPLHRYAENYRELSMHLARVRPTSLVGVMLGTV